MIYVDTPASKKWPVPSQPLNMCYLYSDVFPRVQYTKGVKKKQQKQKQHPHNGETQQAPLSQVVDIMSTHSLDILCGNDTWPYGLPSRNPSH
jgi:hypothetical protein